MSSKYFNIAVETFMSAESFSLPYFVTFMNFMLYILRSYGSNTNFSEPLRHFSRMKKRRHRLSYWSNDSNIIYDA